MLPLEQFLTDLAYCRVSCIKYLENAGYSLFLCSTQVPRVESDLKCIKRVKERSLNSLLRVVYNSVWSW